MDSNRRKELKNRMKYRNLLEKLSNGTRISVYTKARILDSQFKRISFKIIKSDLAKIENIDEDYSIISFEMKQYPKSGKGVNKGKLWAKLMEYHKEIQRTERQYSREFKAQILEENKRRNSNNSRRNEPESVEDINPALVSQLAAIGVVADIDGTDQKEESQPQLDDAAQPNQQQLNDPAQQPENDDIQILEPPQEQESVKHSREKPRRNQQPEEDEFEYIPMRRFRQKDLPKIDEFIESEEDVEETTIDIKANYGEIVQYLAESLVQYNSGADEDYELPSSNTNPPVNMGLMFWCDYYGKNQLRTILRTGLGARIRELIDDYLYDYDQRRVNGIDFRTANKPPRDYELRSEANRDQRWWLRNKKQHFYDLAKRLHNITGPRNNNQHGVATIISFANLDRMMNPTTQSDLRYDTKIFGFEKERALDQDRYDEILQDLTDQMANTWSDLVDFKGYSLGDRLVTLEAEANDVHTRFNRGEIDLNTKVELLQEIFKKQRELLQRHILQNEGVEGAESEANPGDSDDASGAESNPEDAEDHDGAEIFDNSREPGAVREDAGDDDDDEVMDLSVDDTDNNRGRVAQRRRNNSSNDEEQMSESDHAGDDGRRGAQRRRNNRGHDKEEMSEDEARSRSRSRSRHNRRGKKANRARFKRARR